MKGLMRLLKLWLLTAEVCIVAKASAVSSVPSEVPQSDTVSEPWVPLLSLLHRPELRSDSR